MKTFSRTCLAVACFLPAALPFRPGRRGKPTPYPTLSSSPRIFTTIQAVKSREITSDGQVLNVLKDIRVKPPWKTPIISTLTFNFVLRNLLASSTTVPDSVERAHNILRYMIDSGREEIKPDLVSLNTVLAIYSKNSSLKRKQIAKRADELRREWEDLHKRGLVEDNTDRISLNTVMSAFVRAGSISDARRIFGVLRARYQETKDEAIKPDAVSYGTMLRGYSSQGRAQDAEDLFQNMKKDGPPPTVECFNELLYSFAKSPLPGRAEEFLKVWSDDTDEVVRPNIRSYNTVLHALSKNQDPSSILRAERLLNRMPARDATSYTTYINLCCRLPGHMALDATDRALQKASRDNDITMDSSFIANVLYSLSSCDDRDTLPYAESLVERLVNSGQQPNILVYNALLHCWAKSGDRDAGNRANAILAKIREDPSLKPDIKTYTNVLASFTARDPEDIRKAEDIVAQMEREGPKPTTQTYTTLIQNYARSRLPFKAVKAAEVLTRMKESGISDAQPSIVTYNAVLNAAEYTDGSDFNVREEALKVACIAFDEIRNSTIQANHVTYGTFLGVLTNLMTAETRHDIVSLVFKRCCLDGQVSYLVLKKLKTAVVSLEHYQELLMGHNESRLPDSWTCNVQEVRAREIF